MQTMAVATSDLGRRGRQSGFFRLPPPAGTLCEARGDSELVAAMIADEEEAWREFRARYDALVLRSITNVTRRFPTLVGPDDAHDIHASFYLSLVAQGRRKLRAFDAGRGAHLWSWVRVLAVHAAYDHLRSVRSEPSRGTLAEAARIGCDRPDPFEQVVESEQAAIASRVLEEFSKKDRTFAALYFEEELPPGEIASRMKISVKTVYTKKHKLRAKLVSVLDAGGAAPSSAAA
jgi:RNA polymerase sigma-70 factor (ECF subfamily)